MHLQILISIPVWVVVFCSTRVVSDNISEPQKSVIAYKLNTLVRHPGWRYMDNVQIIIKYPNIPRQTTNPIVEILEAISSNLEPVDESNVLIRYKEIWTVLMCKYAAIMNKYKNRINSLIRLCRKERKSFRRYYECFQSLLINLDHMAPRFRCMRDALLLIYSLIPQSGDKPSAMVAAEKLTEYTLTLHPRTMSNLSIRGIDVDAIDHEMEIITDYINMILKNNVQWFIRYYCNVPTQKEWTVQSLNEEFKHKKSIQLISQEMTMVQYVKNEIDSYVDGILGGWFFNLGFTYDVGGNVTIRVH